MPALFKLLILVLTVVLVPPLSAVAGDWPQILGPNRDGQAIGEDLPDRWPEEGPQRLWKRSVGRGYAGAAVRGDRAILFHRIDDEEVVEAVRLTDGKPIWRQAYPAHLKGTIFPDENGPLCVPIIHQSMVFVYGGGGDLRALTFDSGKKLWQRSLYREFRQRLGRIDFGYFGAGSTPIVEGDRILVNVGGFRNAGIMALDIHSGETAWQATEELPSYSAPVATTVDGVRHVVFLTRYHAVSVNPANGDVRFRFPFGQRGPTVNAASPIVVGNQLFATASYGIGAQLSQFDRQSFTEIWASNDAISSQYTTPVYLDGYLYGTDGRADQGKASLRCVEMKTGEIQWSEDGFGVAVVIAAAGKLLIVKSDGQLILATPSPDRFRRLAMATLTGDTIRALPALANGRLLVRDQSTLWCYRVGAAQ